MLENQLSDSAFIKIIFPFDIGNSPSAIVSYSEDHSLIIKDKVSAWHNNLEEEFAYYWKFNI